MFLRVAALSALALFLFSFGCEEMVDDPVVKAPLEDGPVLSPSGVIGGTATSAGDYPGVVAVRLGGGMWGALCTGTLIHPRVVLTAVGWWAKSSTTQSPGE